MSAHGYVVTIRNSGDSLYVAAEVADLEGMVGEEVAGGPQPDCCGAGVLTLAVQNVALPPTSLARYVVVCEDSDQPEYVEQGIKGCGGKRALRLREEHLTVF